MERKAIAPFVKASRFSDIDVSLAVADKSLEYYRGYKQGMSTYPHPCGCVGLAAITLKVCTPSVISNLAKMSGQDGNFVMRQIALVRTALNIKYEGSFIELTAQARLPHRYATTAENVLKELNEKFPNDPSLARPSIYAAILCVITTSRGHGRPDIETTLANVACADVAEVKEAILFVKENVGSEIGLKQKHIDSPLPKEKRVMSDETKIAHAQAMSKAKEKPVRQKQLTLSFG